MGVGFMAKSSAIVENHGSYDSDSLGLKALLAG
jgi:hypothetical protein